MLLLLPAPVPTAINFTSGALTGAANWSLFPPAAFDPSTHVLYRSVGTFNPDGNVIGTFSAPSIFSGADGAKGDQGDQGIQGLKGDQGEAGPRGLQGDPGADGQDGTDGISIQGEQGAQGISQLSVYRRVLKTDGAPATPTASDYNPLLGQRGTFTNLTPGWHQFYADAAGSDFNPAIHDIYESVAQYNPAGPTLSDFGGGDTFWFART